ncbi:meiosis protein SPO22/ZIP4 like-domain-containing protein [Biscogniauxia sp. FL1348]|nr:meiosis protein SPO22/ZIP4 like-domain-containing protein [Biscogniauxia sp. FL1348]
MESPAGSPASGKGKRVRNIISFCRDVRKRFQTEEGDASLRDLTNEVENQINAIKTYTLRSPGSIRHEQLDNAGLELWNWCTQLMRQDDGQAPPLRSRFFVLVRVFSFLVLSLAQCGHNDTLGDLVRLRKLAIKAGRSCIVNGELQFALLALQKAAEYNGHLHNLHDSLPKEELAACNSFEFEYLTLRIALAWKDDRLDVAEHVYGKVDNLKHKLEPISAEHITDSLFEIGRGLLAKDDALRAVKWLERAYELINSQELERLSREGIELRLAVSQALIQAYLHTNTPEGVRNAENHVAFIESEMGNKLVVLLLRLEILLHSSAEVFDSHAYADILRRVIQNVDLSDSSFKLVIHHIRKLEDKSPGLAYSVFDDFITLHVVPTQRGDWIERTILIRTHMATAHRDTIQSIRTLSSLFDRVETGLGQPFTAPTALGVLTLLWKRIEAKEGPHDIAQEWCRLALHSSLRQCGPSNEAKISRKLLLCALQRNDLNAATEALDSMSDNTKEEPRTMYLAYKLALANNDQKMAIDYLGRICESSSKDLRYLYACCVDAQKKNDKHITSEALRQLVKRYDHTSFGEIHLPALLRLLIRMEISLLHEQDQTKDDRHSLLEDLCDVFEGAVAAIRRVPLDEEGQEQFTIDELDWFCKNAYNYVLRILQCCLSIISLYPKDIPAHMSADLSLRGMFCNFLAATALITLARCEDDIEVQLQNYLTMRHHIKQFDDALEASLEILNENPRHDLQTKLSTLLVFDFEGATCKSLSTLQAMADCILRTQTVPGHVLHTTLRKLINYIWELEHFDHDKLAKYMRCLLKATLPLEPEVPLRVIEEICDMVKQSVETQNLFPPLELEWFTTTAFNHGVDLYSSHDDELSKQWLAHAFTLAHYHQDGGVLEQQLQEKHTNLKWDDNPGTIL